MSSPYPIPLPGTFRNCSFTSFKVRLISPWLFSSHTGYIVVNHPTVRVRSIPSISSSLPCPSKSTNTPFFPLHCSYPCTRAVSSTSLICVRYFSGTSFNKACVSPSLSHTTTLSTLPTVLSARSASSRLSAFFITPFQYSNCPCTSADPAYSFIFPAHCWKELLFFPNSTPRPSFLLWHPACKSSSRILHDTPST